MLFERATERLKANQEGRDVPQPTGGLGDIVMVPSVKEARERGVLKAVRPFEFFTPDGVVWKNGDETTVDANIWRTGFASSLNHLRGLGVVNSQGRVDVHDNRSSIEPRLWLLGYGDWTGLASATLIGVRRDREAGDVIFAESRAHQTSPPRR